MADNSFDTMVEDMQTQLEEEKEMEQQLFDERLEEMDWYWDEVDRIMAEGTESVLDTMQLYLDDFNQASELQQVELLKGWENTFEQAAVIGKAGASTMQGVIAEIQKELNGENVEEYLKYLNDSTINTQYSGRQNYSNTGTSSGGSNNGASTGTTYYSGTKDKVINQVNEELNTGVDTSVLQNNNGSDDTKPESAFKAGQNVRTKEAFGIVKTYGYDKNTGKFEDKLSNDFLLLGGKHKFEIDKNGVEYYNGQYYYKAKGMDNVWFKGLQLEKYKKGGMVYGTGPAWLDGTSSHPEAVLNAMQTKAFLSFTDDLAALRAEGGVSTNSSVVIDSISFNVESMSSVADGEKAFNTFVDKFKEIGAKQGISILGTANRN